jgi:hypothetical protein
MPLLHSFRTHTAFFSLLSFASLVLAGAQGYKWG